MIRSLIISALAVAFCFHTAAAQTSADTRASGSVSAGAQVGTTQASGSASASTDTQATAGKSGAQAGSSTSSSGEASASRSSKEKSGATGKDSGRKGSASASGDLAAGSKLNAVLSKPVDSRKCKPGDPIVATTTDSVKSGGQVVIPRHSQLIGHVTQASAKANGDSNSSLGIMFDKAVLKNGREVPVHALVQALAASQSGLMADQEAPEMEPMAPMASTTGAVRTTGAANGGMLGSTVGATTNTVGGAASGLGQTVGATSNAAGNVGSTVDASTRAAGNVAGNVGGSAASVATDASGRLLASSRGVAGLPGLTLQSAASNATQGSIVTSSGKNVHLDSGTQMLLEVVSQ